MSLDELVRVDGEDIDRVISEYYFPRDDAFFRRISLRENIRVWVGWVLG